MRADDDTPEQALSRDVAAMRRALSAYVVVLVVKLVAWLLSGAVVLLAEALHSLSDVVIAVFLLAAASIAARTADEDHAFGHDRAQNAAALVAATLLLAFTTFQVYREALPQLWQPIAPVRHVGLAMAILGASMAVSAWPLLGLLRHRGRGPAATAQLVDLANDELGLLAAIVGLALVVAGFPRGDPIAALIVGAIIATNALRIFRENFVFLLGRSPEPAFLERLRAEAGSVEGVLGTHELLAEYIGPRSIRVSMHVVVSAELTIVEADRIAEEVQRRLCELPDCRFCLVHLDAGHEERRPGPATT